MTSDIADVALADSGQRRIEWADSQMPVLRQIRERFASERPLEGLVVGACLHVTAETAGLVRALQDGGASVAICASNPLSTQDDVAAALVDRHGAGVYAIHGEGPDTYYRHIDAVCDQHPRVTLDDGADLVSMLHAQREAQLPEIVGGTESTTTGALRVRALVAAGRLAFPVLAVSDAAAASLIENRYGTGQSTLDGIVRATNVLLAGSRMVVLGYGSSGRGVALRARGAGAKVIVCEVDPLRALEAAMEGYEVMPAVEAASLGDVFITVTGNRGVLTSAHFKAMKDGALLCNAGHFDVEIDKPALEKLTKSERTVRPLVEEHVLRDGRRLHLLAEGRVVNLAGAEGHPGAVMDMHFSAHALSVEHLARSRERLHNRVHDVPAEINREIARLKLEALGVTIDELTKKQLDYLSSWEQGT
ncbi:MAG TPA: adenosylhomocysteinase [Thermoleophilaceae bacterium]